MARWSRVARCSWLSLPTKTKSPLDHMVTEVAVGKADSVVQAQPVSKIPVASIRPKCLASICHRVLTGSCNACGTPASVTPTPQEGQVPGDLRGLMNPQSAGASKPPARSGTPWQRGSPRIITLTELRQKQGIQ